jgi:Flp pilus assembly protein TadG
MEMKSWQMNIKYPTGWRLRMLLCSRGQTLLEFALLLPILLLLALGVIEMGRFAYIGIMVGNAARSGVAWGAQNAITAGNTAGIIAAAQNDFEPRFGTLNVTSQWNNNCACDNGGTLTAISCTTACPVGQHLVTSLSVTASGNFDAIFKNLGFPGIPTSITISRTATQRIGN